MGRRIRLLPGVDRSEFGGKSVGLWRPGGHPFDRRLFVVRLFHRPARALKTCERRCRLMFVNDAIGLTDAGKIGLWTKADGVTLFDEVTCGETNQVSNCDYEANILRNRRASSAA